MEMQLLMGCIASVLVGLAGMVFTLTGAKQKNAAFIGVGISVVLIAILLFVVVVIRTRLA